LKNFKIIFTMECRHSGMQPLECTIERDVTSQSSTGQPYCLWSTEAKFLTFSSLLWWQFSTGIYCSVLQRLYWHI